MNRIMSGQTPWDSLEPKKKRLLACSHVNKRKKRRMDAAEQKVVGKGETTGPGRDDGVPGEMGGRR